MSSRPGNATTPFSTLVPVSGASTDGTGAPGHHPPPRAAPQVTTFIAGEVPSSRI